MNHEDYTLFPFHVAMRVEHFCEVMNPSKVPFCLGDSEVFDFPLYVSCQRLIPTLSRPRGIQKFLALEDAP